MDAHLNSGIVYQKMGQTDQAITQYLKVLELNPSDTSALVYLADMEIVRDNFSQAKTYIEKALQSNPNLAEAHFIYGMILQHFKEIPQSTQHIKKAISLNPNFEQKWKELQSKFFNPPIVVDPVSFKESK